MAKKIKKSCKTCAFAKFRLTAKGNYKTSLSGDCKYVVPTPEWPQCVKNHMLAYSWPISKRSIWPDGKDGKDCNCWKEITSNNR